jgi:peptidoglycan/LPS O-acetylase OafA/YrhL
VNVLLLIGFAINGGAIARTISSRFAGYLGEASYSMYILHVPLLWWYSRFAFQQMGGPLHTGAALAYLAFVILASIAAFELVEKPANRWLRNRANEYLATSATRTFVPLRPRFDTPAESYSRASVPAASESAY